MCCFDVLLLLAMLRQWNIWLNLWPALKERSDHGFK